MDERSCAALDSLLVPTSAALANEQGVLEPKPYFDPQTVVSRDARGEPVSRYGDEQWDFSSQSTDGKSGAKLSFFTVNNDENPNLSALIREQHKALLWLHIDAGKMRALETVKHSRRATDVWCQKAHRRGV